MDDFTQKMLERAKLRREKLNNQLNQAGLTPRAKNPLQESNSHNVMSQKPAEDNVALKRSDFDGKDLSKKSEVKSKLQRLGELYSENPDLSSPIHRSEDQILTETPTMNAKSKCRLGRLNELASTINQWEDDLSHIEPKKEKNTKNIPKNDYGKNENNKPKVTDIHPKTSSQISLDKSTIKSLKSQGFALTENSLVYEFDKKSKSPRGKLSPYQKNPSPKRPSPKMGLLALEKKESSVLQRAALFEKKSETKTANSTKDPAELSLAERKALFEKNRGEVLLPKVAFATPLPAKLRESSPKKQKHHVAVASVESTASTDRLEREKELQQLKTRWERKKEEQTAVVAPPSPPTPPTLPLSPPAVIYKDSPETLKAIRDVKKIVVSPQKEGRLYPSLSDIDDDGPSGESSSSSCFEESRKSDLYMNMSFADILAASQTNSVSPRSSNSLRESSVLDEMDAVLDAAMDDMEGATPPKQGRFEENSESFEYQKPETPLMHTVSFYRRQQNSLSASNTPMKVVTIPTDSYTKQENLSDLKEPEAVQKKIENLLTEVGKQQTIISQASNLLSVCLANIEFSGSEEQVEGERLLLLAGHKRQACLNEIQRLRVEATLKPRASNSDAVIERGDILVSNIALPLKREAMRAMAAEENVQYFVCLVKCNEQVLATPVVMVSKQNLNGNILMCPGEIKLENLYGDFTASIEVYHMVLNKDILPHHIKYHLPGKKEKKLLTPLKNKKSQSRLVMPNVQSPAGPNAVRTTNFKMSGYAVFSLREIRRTEWSLNKVPFDAPVEGSISMKIYSDLKSNEEHRGFLTMFEDISGLGSWHRRWCVLSSYTLSYWKYPDDETKKIPLGSIDLRTVATEHVTITPREICARLHTFLVETTRPLAPSDSDSLVMVVDREAAMTKVRHLLSADTKEERIEWCKWINRALGLIRAWGCNGEV